MCWTSVVPAASEFVVEVEFGRWALLLHLSAGKYEEESWIYEKALEDDSYPETLPSVQQGRVFLPSNWVVFSTWTGVIIKSGFSEGQVCSLEGMYRAVVPMTCSFDIWVCDVQALLRRHHCCQEQICSKGFAKLLLFLLYACIWKSQICRQIAWHIRALMLNAHYFKV
eukprot:jgi/Botrbrau1/23607/Bobra.55_2s0004.1